jgi:hypothetical protein
VTGCLHLERILLTPLILGFSFILLFGLILRIEADRALGVSHRLAPPSVGAPEFFSLEKRIHGLSERVTVCSQSRSELKKEKFIIAILYRL